MDRLRDYSLLKLTTAASASDELGGLPRKPYAAPSKADRIEKLRHKRTRSKGKAGKTGGTGLHVLPLALGDDPRGRPVLLPCAIERRPGANPGEAMPMVAQCDKDEDNG